MKPGLIAAGLLAGCFTLAVTIEPKLAEDEVYARHDLAPIEIVLGDVRRLLAGHFFTKADVYFHSGYYPSIFDHNTTNRSNHILAGAGFDHGEHDAEFLGKPLDCIDAFSRRFFPSTHTHLDGEKHEAHEHGAECNHAHDEHESAQSGKVGEMLPWVKITAGLDPNRVETYTVGAYWLRTRMGKAKDAEAFLREGLRKNPRHYSILFELGRIFHENYQEVERPRHVWEAALERWIEARNLAQEPDPFLLLQITWHLALLEKQAGNFEKALSYLNMAKEASPNPAAVEKRIQEIARARN